MKAKDLADGQVVYHKQQPRLGRGVVRCIETVTRMEAICFRKRGTVLLSVQFEASEKPIIMAPNEFRDTPNVPLMKRIMRIHNNLGDKAYISDSGERLIVEKAT